MLKKKKQLTVIVYCTKQCSCKKGGILCKSKWCDSLPCYNK